MEIFRDRSCNMEDRVKNLISLLTLEEKCGFLSTRQSPVERLGIGEWYVGAEVARGYVSRDPHEPTTVFPEPVGLACSFDEELMYNLGKIAGDEARGIYSRHKNGHLMLWGPTVDMCRNPLWGRNEEGYGEDPCLTGTLSKAYTLGMADKCGEYLKTIPTLKHFCANNTEPERGHADSQLNPRTKHEYYYAAFRPAIKYGGAYSIMAAYNEISGVPGLINPDIKDVLKKDWGLLFAVTDGGDFAQNVLLHKYGKSHAETLALAIKAGTNVMTDNADLVKASALRAIKEGLITEGEIDDCIYETLLARFKLGEFDDIHPYSDINDSIIESENARKLNHKAALEQFVLLKNEGILPIQDKKAKICVIGINGNENLMDWYTGYSSYNVSIYEGITRVFEDCIYDDGCDDVAIKSKATGKYLRVDENEEVYANSQDITDFCTFKKSEYGNNETTYKNKGNNKYFTAETYKASSDTTFRWFTQEILRPVDTEGYRAYKTYFNSLLAIDENGKIKRGKYFGIDDSKLFSESVVSDGIKRAVEIAKGCDYCIVCVGNDPMIEAREMYDRKSLALPKRQSQLVRAVYEANHNTIMAVVSGYPYSINEENDYLPAIIYTSHAGPELGTAFARVITGEYNPAGRLCQTWYKSELELPDINEYDIIENDMTYMYYKGKALYPFGYGLSYSSFTYGNFSLEQKENELIFKLDITNNSDIPGDDVPQIYFRKENSRVKRPLKQLCTFKRVNIPAKSTVRVTLPACPEALYFYDVISEGLRLEGGEYTFFAGKSSNDDSLSVKAELKGNSALERDITREIKAVNHDSKYGTTMKWSKKGGFHYMYGGGIIFTHCKGKISKARLVAVSAEGYSEITISLEGKELARVKIPPSVDIEDFSEFTADIEPVNADNGTLVINLSGYCGLKSFIFE